MLPTCYLLLILQSQIDDIQHYALLLYFQGRKTKYFVSQKIYETFLHHQWGEGYLSYDDIIYFAIKLTQRCPHIFNFLIAKFPYFFIDEFQDSIPPIIDLVKEMAHYGCIVGVVGDKAQTIYDFIGASPMLVKLIMKSIYKQNKREIKHIGSKRFGVQFLLKSIYANNGLLYFHTELKNTSNIPFDVDYVSFKIVDKKVIKRTAMQEQVLEPLRAQNYVTVVHGKSSERTVFALEKFTIPDDKQLVIEIAEKEGGRHQSFVVENEDIVRANVIDELSIQ